MDTSNKMFLDIVIYERKRGVKSKISFEIKATEDIKGIVKELRRKRTKILSYGIRHVVDLNLPPATRDTASVTDSASES